MFRTVRLSIRSLFSVDSALVCVIQVCRQLTAFEQDQDGTARFLGIQPVTQKLYSIHENLDLAAALPRIIKGRMSLLYS
jgi:hypothetical protein